MDILYIAIPLALGIAGFFVLAFLWSVRTGQMDDLETPAIRMLFDEESSIPPPSETPLNGPTDESMGAQKPQDSGHP
ncbi:MAG: cbb3-type cytochrome oxidase assembly protein CcoS [Planctomycetes bacterium]|nr:cbb3-type cytochrome oxidase assembly protein CcoS [Planctomycetota bacterium]MCB9910745.1 cbb3-type cytochrome oxidase assembly protein CcoS [Planctomycetota bacterium]MCB9912771.1 cbb3-type cytochrome oxidase assembly protein CcoS [Planctomycetota bacterium]HPF14302.1 cbb3-type cytochrome oxidase assembly protein CcoS [Planctomycetota bacterium]HRV80763.1 cbb3-type cytochrome oxidase assembly protein CcoS [Planctomycetota bacterium]